MKQFSPMAAVVLFGSMAAAQSSQIGCYESTLGLKFANVSDFNSVGFCGVDQCKKFAAFAMQGTRCYCGNEIPPDSAKVDNSKCNFPCKVWPQDNCGGSVLNSFFMVYDQGTAGDIPKAHASSSSPTPTPTPTPGPSSSAFSATTAAQPINAEASEIPSPSSSPSPSPSPSPPGSSSGGSRPNTAGIAAGVVVGIVAILAIAGGIFLFLRNRKRKAIEEEHRRNAAANSFVNGGKPPTSSGGASSFADNRLDPVMAQRRMSDGSIADNQDYSRRILKVTNA